MGDRRPVERNPDQAGVHYESDPAVIREVLPEPLEPDGNHVIFEWMKMLDSSGFGSYQENGIKIAARWAKAAIPGMKQRGWGRIINIASAHGLVASPQKVAYVAAKHGVLGMTKVAAIETANHGITVNAICPGWVLTPLVQRQLEDHAKQQGTDVETQKQRFLTEKQAMAEFSTPEQIGALAVFLCSEAARTITGAPISIDGGWVAQ